MELDKVIEALFGNSFVAALLGGLVGGWFTRNATYKAHALSKNTAQLENLRAARSAIALIAVEIKSAWHIYNLEYAADLMEVPDGQAYLASWVIGRDPFVIYDSMPQCLTELPEELSGAVVQMYMRMKGVVAMVEENNIKTEEASKAGLDKLDSIFSNLTSAKVGVSAEQIKVHEEYLEAYIQWYAVKIGMGGHADAMKLLTGELSVSMPAMLFGLDKALENIDNKILGVEALVR